MTPLFNDLKATTIFKAFILNSIVSSLSIITALYVNKAFDRYYNHTGKNIIITMILTFITSFLTYTIMYFIFGYGQAMIVKK